MCACTLALQPVLVLLVPHLTLFLAAALAMQARDTIGTIIVHVFTCQATVSPAKALKKTVQPDTADEYDEAEKGKEACGVRPGKGDDSAHGNSSRKPEE